MDAKSMTQELIDNGIFALSIQYPIVALGKARLRVIISADHEIKVLDAAIGGFEEAGRKLSII